MSRITGTIEHIIYKADNRQYAVLLVQTDDNKIIKATGSVYQPKLGERMSFDGEFKEHPKYGQQFSFNTALSEIYDESFGIESFLKSSLIKGIGEKKVRRLIEKFGEDSIGAIIENEPARLTEVKGIGLAIAQQVHDSYMNHKMKMELIKRGISVPLTEKIFEKYGSNSYAVLKRNPYSLISDLEGIGFIRADEIATKLGIDSNNPFRAQSGVKYTLQNEVNSGNSYILTEDLILKSALLLNVERVIVVEAIRSLTNIEKIIIDTDFGDERCYLPEYYDYEACCSHKLLQISSSAVSYNIGTLDELLAEYELIYSKELSVGQREAVISSITHKASVITGGPGTGKTTIVNAIVYILKMIGRTFKLCAPTGRAAKRLSEATGEEAKTIHRLLECVYENGRLEFKKGLDDQLDSDFIIVDEMSMLDIRLFSQLLDAVNPSNTSMIFVGDKDQLPSVSAGNVLNDIVASGVIHTTYLKEIYRQEHGSLLVENAHKINNGHMPDLDSKKGNFRFIEMIGQSEISEYIEKAILNNIEKHSELIYSDRLQIISPLRKGDAGVISLNKMLQNLLNPPSFGKAEESIPFYTLREGDKIMQIKNNYQARWENIVTRESGQGIFNGEMGFVEQIDKTAGKLVLLFDRELRVIYDFSDIDNLTLAYAITIHKSQGCEFDTVIIAMFPSNPDFLSRNLLYTAITRAKLQVTIIGNRRTVANMVQNSHTQKRQSGLKDMLVRSFSN